jgi:hypothetical protein
VASAVAAMAATLRAVTAVRFKRGMTILLIGWLLPGSLQARKGP